MSNLKESTAGMGAMVGGAVWFAVAAKQLDSPTASALDRGVAAGQIAQMGVDTEFRAIFAPKVPGRQGTHLPLPLTPEVPRGQLIIPPVPHWFLELEPAGEPIS